MSTADVLAVEDEVAVGDVDELTVMRPVVEECAEDVAARVANDVFILSVGESPFQPIFF